MSVPNRLKEERTRVGKSQKALADIGGVGLSSQKSYEREGGTNPDTAYLEKIGEYVDTAYVLTGVRSGGGVSEESAGDSVEPKKGKKDPIAFDPEVAEEAVVITDKLLELFFIPAENKKDMVPLVYSFLMMGNFGTTEEDMIKLWDTKMGWPRREK